MDKIPIPSYETTDLPSSVQRLSIHPGLPLSNSSRVTRSTSIPSFSKSNTTKHRCRSLVSLCLGVLGRHLEDVIEELSEISVIFPPDIKMTLLGIAKRRGLLSDSVLLALVDCSWELLDISGSDVTDAGLQNVAETCLHLKAVDVSRCNRLTSKSICALLQKCHSLEILRCGGTPLSDFNARRCLDFLKPKLNEVEEDSWEELDSKDITTGAWALRWLIWPSIDEDSNDCLNLECPRISVNPSTLCHRGVSVPREALPGIVLDAQVVEDIDPKTWTINAAPRLRTLNEKKGSEPGMIPKAELFRLAFVERDERLAPKRAKNMRQHQRRAEREFIKSDTGAKSLFLASLAQKSLRK